MSYKTGGIIDAYREFLIVRQNEYYSDRTLNENRYNLKRKLLAIKKILLKRGLKENELVSYFRFQGFRFKKRKLTVPLKWLIEEKTIELFKSKQEVIGHAINFGIKNKTKKYVNRTSDKRLLKIELNSSNDERIKYRFLKREKTFKGIFFFCLSNEFFFSKDSTICLNCKHKKQCQKNME